MLRMTGIGADADDAKVELVPNVRIGHSSYGPANARLVELMAAVPTNASVGELRVGMASGPGSTT